MKRLMSLALTVIMTASLCAVNVTAAQDVSVKIDGRTISYSEVDPEIINDRVMVPIRETAEYLGMTVNWNAGTSTATFSGDGLSITHTIYTNIMTVNGEVRYFDVASTNVDGRTLVPVRMLAEATGAEVDWDGVAYQVTVTSASVATPIVISAVPSKTTAIVGDAITVTITTNDATSMVRLADSNSLVSKTITSYESRSGNRVFTATLEATTNMAGNNTMYVFAANSSGVYNDYAEGVFTLSVTAGSAAINSIDVSKSSVSYGTTVTFNVFTATGAAYVYIYDPDGTLVAEAKTFTETNGEYRWQLSFKAKTSGYYVTYTENASGTRYSSKNKITVDEGGYSITDYTVSDKSVEYGDTVDVKVYTQPGATKVWIVNPDGDTVDTTKTYDDDDDDEYVWVLDFKAKVSGTYYVYSTDGDDEDYESFKLTVDEDSSSGDGYSITKVTVDYTYNSKSVNTSYTTSSKSITIDEGTKITLTVKTENGTGYVSVYDPASNRLKRITSSSGSSSYTWDEYTFKPTDEGKYTIYAYSEDDDDDYNKVTLTISFD